MKLALFKTCFWVLSHFIVQQDSFPVAVKLYQNKQFKETIAVCNSQLSKMNAKDTLYERFLSLRSTSYMELHDLDAAVKDYRELIVINPKSVGYYVNLAQVYDIRKQYDTCFTLLNVALKLNPEDATVLNDLSYCSGGASKYEDAIKYADEGLKFRTDSATISALLNNRGYGCIGLKRYTEALSYINIAIKWNPNNAYAYCFRALTHIRTKEMETVCSDLEKAKSLDTIDLTEELIKENCKR